MNSETVTFFNQSIKLVGVLHKPKNNKPCPAIVAVHPASCGMCTDPFYDHLKSELPRHGIAVLVFDRRGSGGSSGDFVTADFNDLADDVLAAVEFLRSHPDIDEARIGLHGTSQGAWIAPIAAAKKPEIACVVAVSASGVTPAEQMDYGVAFHLKQAGFDQSIIAKAIELRTLVNEYFRGKLSREQVALKLERYESEPWFDKSYLFTSRELPREVTLSKWHYEMDYEPLSIWRKVMQPVLFLFAEVDEWVPIDASMENYKAATSHLRDVTFHRVKGTDHLMCISEEEDPLKISPDYLAILLEWLTSRLER